MPRPKDETSGRIFESLVQAANVLKIDVAILRRCKKLGCPGMAGSRVRELPLLKFIEDNPDVLTGHEGEQTETLESLKKDLLRENIRKAREAADSGAISNAKKRGELISRQDLEFAIPKCLAHAISIQRKHLPTDIFNIVCKETKEGFGRILIEAMSAGDEDMESEGDPIK